MTESQTQKVEVTKEEELLFKLEEQEIPKLLSFNDIKQVDITYPLIPPYASVRIHWDNENSELVYEIKEPALTENDKEILNILEEGIKELINMSFIHVKDRKTVLIYLEKNVKVLLTELSISLTMDSYLNIMYYIYRDFVGFNELEPLMNDYYIEDVECNGINTPVYIVHRKFRNVRTNLIYTDLNKLVNFVEKLAQKCGKYVSYAEPLLDGALPDGSRVNATYSMDVSSRGPTFTVRRFTKEPWNPIQLMQKGTASAEVYAYLWMAIEYENSMMIIGGTGTGKTSFINSTAFFFPPQARIVTIEDTKELQLEHENWLPSVARAGVGLTNLVGQRYGEVSLFDLLKASFRQRPDYIIVGEVRGKEAFVLFQAFASIRGNEEIFILYDNKPLRIKIKDLCNYDIKKVKTFSYNIKNKKCEIVPIKGWIRHPKRNQLYKVTTKSGREITITKNHSVFTFENGNIQEIQGQKLTIGNNLIIPSYIECGYNNLEKLNLLEFLPDLRIYAPQYIKEASHKIGYSQANLIIGCKSVTDYYSGGIVSKPGSLKANKFFELMKKTDTTYDLNNLKVKCHGISEKVDVFLDITDEFLRLIGYYLSEGSLNTHKRNYRISLYSKNEEILEDMKNCIIKVSKKIPEERITDRGYGSATELSFNHKILYDFIKKYCKFKLDKRVPDFVYGLDKRKIGIFLGALYAGDENLREKGITYYTCSKDLATDVAQLLLIYGIVANINKRNRNGKKTTDYEINFYADYKKKEFLKYVNAIGKPLNPKNNGIEDKKLLDHLYCDKIKSIEVLNLDKPEYVYDLIVPSNQNFIGGFGSVLLHNSGHPGMATMHAENVQTLVRRLMTNPINLSGSLVETLSAVVVMQQTRIRGEEARKVASVDEIISVGENGKSLTNPVFVWDPKTDRFSFNANSRIFDNISTHFGMTKEQVLHEFQIRSRLLRALYSHGIFNYKEVQKIIHEYYKSPDAVLKRYNVT